MLVHYVQFLQPGALVSETSNKRIRSRNPENVKLPSEFTFGFRFFSQIEVTKDGEKLIGRAKDWSGTYYPDGTIYSLKEVKRYLPNEKILISNMTINNMETVVKTCIGNFQQFNKDTDHIYKLKNIKKNIKLRG